MAIGKFGNLPGKTGERQNFHPGKVAGHDVATSAQRWKAGAIDYGPLALIPFVEPFFGGSFFLISLAVVANAGWLQGLMGQSVGKMITGLKLGQVIRDENKNLMFVPLGPGNGATRIAHHWKDVLTLGMSTGSDPYGQSYADKQYSTYVVVGKPKFESKPPPGKYTTIRPE